jgi:Ca2+-binding EF-hand superfamily protein
MSAMSRTTDDMSVLTKDTAGGKPKRNPLIEPTNEELKDILNNIEPFDEEAERLKQKILLRNDKERLKEAVKSMTPNDIFNLFDDDESGLLGFQEYRELLPALGIEIGDAKAFRYFNVCDSDGSGEIDIDEFKVALFACDPSSGNPVGFVPNKILTPLDAFETFDENGVGRLDEDEFYYAMEYLGLKLKDNIHEKYFVGLDYNRTDCIDYMEFREVFLDVCNVRRELEDRGVEIPSFTFRKKMVAILREILNEEEDKERRALAETRRYKEWIFSVKDKRRFFQRAKWRSYQELRCSLDTAGQVYVFGGGSHKQFSVEPLKTFKTGKFSFEHFERVVEIWKDRVHPEQLLQRMKLQHQAEQQDEKNAEKSMGAIAVKENRIDPYEEAQVSQFLGLNVSENTVSLWGRRIHHVGVSDNVIFALSDAGEVFSWGGNSYWWHEIQPDSIYQSKWRGDVTPRSQLLMGVTEKVIPPDYNSSDLLDGKSDDDKKAEYIKVVCKYFNVWEPPPNVATRMHYLEKELLPKVTHEEIKFGLECRGKQVGDIPKLELVEELYHDIVLEKKLLGERAHKAVKELETQVATLKKRRKFKLAEKVQENIEKMWEPLREVQAEKRAEERAEAAAAIHKKAMKIETDYIDYRKRIVEKREDAGAKYSARGQSLAIDIHGATPRAASIKTPRGYQAGVQISAGTAHAMLIHKNGDLYSWGVGGSGRLGLDVTEKGNPQADVQKPTLVQALKGRPAVRVSCGFNHTACIVAGGDLYMWGSAALGKCGLGDNEVLGRNECYCSVPTKVMVGTEDRRIKKVSCGKSHTAVISEGGQLYVFGCGDGGRLGLGDEVYNQVPFPKLVTGLTHENVTSVSCGNSTTIALTEIKWGMVGKPGHQIRQLVGGKAYIAGSGNVFGRQYSSFTYLKDMEGIPVKQVSAGYQHTALISADGELYCWGSNRNVCCGTSPHVKFIEHPTAVSCLFQRVRNLAIGCASSQSSIYQGRDAEFAFDGNIDGFGLKNCSSTQMDAQPYIEVDLGTFGLIDEIKIWNRTDSPPDTSKPPDTFSSRLFPCWVFIGQDPFDPAAGHMTLNNAKTDAIAKIRFTENQRVSSWKCPANCQGRYVRLQLESYTFLNIAQLEVLGNWGISAGVGRVSCVTTGRDVTCAVIRAKTDPHDFEKNYARAVFSDAENADILRQYESYGLEYDKFGRGETLGKCIMCHGTTLCEICILNKMYKEEIENIPSGIGGRRRRLVSMEDELINNNRPELVLNPVRRVERPTRWEVFKKKWFPKFNLFAAFTPKDHSVSPEFEHSTMLLDGFNGQEDLMHRHDDDSSVMSGNSQVNSILPTGGASGKPEGSSRKPSSPSRGGGSSVSGHSVKEPFPRSIGGKVTESKDVISKKKRRKKEKKSKTK